MSLPPIDSALLPADIRQAPQARKDAYTAALGFEQMLVQQLTESLASSARSAMGGDSPYANLMPQAMADGVMDAGGLGLARQLTDAMAPAQTPRAPEAAA
ncbi:hypothetical protein [Conexibacter sp. CPCC 206217]|uniref:hypothetical protein n=1 Tax=Conexibacter sp. CPCC 206217 TaxID=3064574 RepID=UPI00271998C5|nr:hypothetical protein [Conexibacter sp. CPCC 206217]MDO8211438.1 hypothetical protein [Conexibacter sp. CPCC 206217]